VRELVNDDDVGMPCNDGVQVHLLECCTTILGAPTRNDLEIRNLRGGFSAAMHLDEAHYNVDSATAEVARLVQHAVRLSDTRGGADIHLQSAAWKLTNEFQEVGSLGCTWTWTTLEQALRHRSADARGCLFRHFRPARTDFPPISVRNHDPS